MANGTTKAIKDIQIGDKVLASDPDTGQSDAKAVTALHKNDDADLADVTLTDTTSDESTVLHTTWHHPFWNADTGMWTEAQDLKPGTHLLDADGRTAIMVTGVETWTGLQRMRDLTVADTHTYYVMAGERPILVHNVNLACPRPGHLADLEVYDAQGNLVRSGSTYFSGRQIPEEAAQGPWKGSMASHTEARATREAGSPWPYWTSGDDPILGRIPANPGETYVLYGELPPCSWCAVVMEEAAATTGANWIYSWLENGERQWWVRTPQ